MLNFSFTDSEVKAIAKESDTFLSILIKNACRPINANKQNEALRKLVMSFGINEKIQAIKAVRSWVTDERNFPAPELVESLSSLSGSKNFVESVRNWY